MSVLLHEDLTRQVIGIAFKVYNAMGYGVREQYIHRAFAQEFRGAGIPFEHEVVIPLTYNGERIGTYRIDFIVGTTVVVELKVVPFVKHVHVRQVLEYLRSLEKTLALLIFFTQTGVKVKRILLPKIAACISSSSV
mgnify:CR=1 FL=1